jgi:hypothetical protein
VGVLKVRELRMGVRLRKEISSTSGIINDARTMRPGYFPKRDLEFPFSRMKSMEQSLDNPACRRLQQGSKDFRLARLRVNLVLLTWQLGLLVFG